VGLSDDQRALLRLLARREEGYEDIAALMGLSVGEVRARVKGALEGLDEGNRDEGGRAAGPVAAETSESRSPRPQPPKRPGRVAAASQSRARAALPRSRRRLAELAGGALVVVLLVLFATGAIDIGGDSDGNGGDGSTAVQDAPANAAGLTQAVLEPPEGGEASGRALFGRVGKNPVLQVQADGLDPSPPGQSYTVWLYRAPKLALRVGAVQVGGSGGLAAQLPVPLELLGLVANGTFKEIRVSLTGDAAYEAEVRRAKAQNRLPRYSGETALEGEIAVPSPPADG
jgi:hypothetical protein